MRTEQEFAFVVEEGQEAQRLDVFLTGRMPAYSRASLQRAIDSGSALVNGVIAKAALKVQVGDLIDITLIPPGQGHIQPQRIKIDIVFEDNDLMVINKAKGMVVHPAPGAEDGTLVNALLAHCEDLSEVNGPTRPGIVHRLDKDTTGLMMVAKNDAAHHALQLQIQQRTAKRRYQAIVWGNPPWNEAIVDAPIGRHPGDPKRMAVAAPNSRASARHAVTEVFVRERFSLFTRIECSLQTGRTHQIRLHCEFAGYPVVGDPIYSGLRRVPSDAMEPQYGNRLNEILMSLRGQALHAYSLSFDHPTTGERLSFEVPPHREFQELLDFLRALPPEYRGV